MRFTLTLGLLVSVLVVPALAEAAPRRYRERRYEGREDYGYYPRHEGLFLRGTLGLGGITADDDLNELTLRGGAVFFSLDIGGSLSRDLALHGRYSINSMFEPSVSSGDEDLYDLEDTSLSFQLLGLGLTYYLPSNLYLTGVLGLSRASFQDAYGEEYDALNGVGFQGDIGYEWPIGGDFGLGVAARIELDSVSGDDEKLQTAGIGVLVSLTYF
jgi:hypothetical protein